MSAIDDYMDAHSLSWNNPSFDSRGQKPYVNYDDQDMLSYLHDNLMAGAGAFMNTGAHIVENWMTPEALESSYDIPWLEKKGKELQEEYSHNYTPGTAGYYGAMMLQSAPEMLFDTATGAAAAAAASSILGPIGSAVAGSAAALARAVKWGKRAVDFYTKSKNPIARGMRYFTPAPQTVLATVAQTPIEAKFEGQRATDDYIDEAKRKGTYVPGQTEYEAKQLGDRVFRDNMIALTGTNVVENAMTFGRGKKGFLRGLGRFGAASGMEGLEEGIQQIIPKAENGEDWSVTDQDVIDSVITGAIMGGGMHLVGRGARAAFPNAFGDSEGENRTFANAILDAQDRMYGETGGAGTDYLNASSGTTSGPMALIAEANASTNAKLAADNAAAQKAAEQASQPAFAVAQDEQAQESAGSGSLPTYDQKFYTITDEVSDTNLDADTEARLNILAHDYQAQFGEPLQVTSMKRNGGGGSWHDSGQAFDVAGGGLESNENGEREWLMQRGQELGLTPLDEYAHPSKHATGLHIHFSNHEDGSAPSLGDVSTGNDAGGGLTLSSGDEQIDAWIQEAADANGVPANLLSALLDVESGYNVDTPNSEAGAIGIAQFMPGTAEAMGIDPRDPHQAISGAARLLKQEYDHYGNWSQALEAYNGGEGNVGSGETQAYAQKVLGKAGDISHVGGGNRASSGTNFLNEKSSFDINSDDAEGRKMISDFIDYWGNRANVDDADTIQGMLDANGKFRNTQENRDTVREKWGDELQQYADEHMTDEQQAGQETKVQKQARQQADAARRAAQGGKKAASADNTKATIDTSTPNLDAAKQQQVSTTPQATSIDTAGESEQTQAEPAQSLPNTAHLQPNTEHPASETAHPATAAQANAPAQAKAQQAQPTTQASQPTAQAAPIEQAKAPNVPKNEPQNAQQNSQAPAQPQTPTMDAQQATKQQNALPQSAQTSQRATAQMSPAQQRARAAKEQRLQKELETNATLDQIERGQQLEAAAKQASVALPQGMAGALHRGQPQAIAQATSLLKGKGVALPTVEASGNTVYGAAETTGRGNSAQTPRKQLTTKASYTDKSQEHGRGSLNGDKITAWDGSKGGIPKKGLNFSVTLDEVEKALASYGNGRAGLRKLVKQRYDAAVERWIESAKNPEVRAKRRHYWEDDTIHMKGGAAYDRAVDSYARVVEHLYEAATGQKAESPFERRMRERNEAKSQVKEAVANGGRGNSAQNATAPRKVEPAKNASGQQMEKPSSKKSTPSRKPVKGKAGKSVTVTTDSGKELHARYRIVPASSLTTSNVYDGDTIAKNDAYPQELQPRERSGRKEMQAQTDGMAADLHPADLEASRNLNQGAPLIRSDGVVLNGNGRTMAITRAYALRNKAGKRYTQYLIEHAEDFGFTKDQMRAAVKAKGTGKPVLVRELTDDADEATTQDIINSKTGGARMSATEQAETDAKSITSRDFDGYDAESDGDLTKAGNDGFVAKLLRKLVGKDEINAYTDANGSVNQDGYRRVKRAIFSRAYGDTDLIAKMAESMDDAIKNISNGLQSAAANVARLNLKMQEGNAYSYPLADTIARAVKKYNAIKEGKAEANVEAYANENETSLTGGDPEEVVKIVQALDDFHRSGKKIGAFLNGLADILDHQGSPKEDATALDFGEAAKPLTFSEAIDQAKEKTETGGEQDLFGAPKYSIEKAKERHERTLADLKREIASAFPGAKNVREDGDRIAFDMPNGSHLEIWTTDNIELSSEEEAQAKRDHGVTGDMHIKVNGYEVTVGKDAIIALSKAGEKGTAYHEVLHIAMDILFSDREKAALAKKFGKGRGTVEEHIAEAFRRYKLAREHGAHVPFGKLFQRIQDFFANLADHYKELTGTMTDADIARRAFRELANGKAWERDAGEGRGARKYAGGRMQNRAANADENPVDNAERQADNEARENIDGGRLADAFNDVQRRVMANAIPRFINTFQANMKISDGDTFPDIREKLLYPAKKIRNIALKNLRRNPKSAAAKNKLALLQKELDYERWLMEHDAGCIRSVNEFIVRDEQRRLSESSGKDVSRDAAERSARRAGRLAEERGGRIARNFDVNDSAEEVKEIRKGYVENGQHYSVSRSDSQDGFSRAKNPRKFAGEANADENPVDNRNGQNDNEGEERARFIDRLLNEKVPENGRTSIDSDVKDGIARFGKEITPENVEDVFDSLHCVRMLRATFNDNGRMQNYANGLDYAQKMATYMYGYARRCFENDERIKRQLALRGASVGRPEEVRNAHAEGRPGRAGEGTPRNGGQALQGTSLAKHGNVKALQELYDKLVDEAYHGKQYSVSRSDNQDGFSRAQNPRKYSIAYHGTQHEFDQFDVGKIGSGEGSQVHGWGIYFAKDRKISEGYRDLLSDNEHKGMLAEVEVPDDDVLLDEQKNGAEQPKGVRKALHAIVEDIQKSIDKMHEVDKVLADKSKSLDERLGFEAEDRDALLSDEKTLLNRVAAARTESDDKALGIYNWITMFEPLEDGRSGKEIYEKLSQLFGGDDRASRILNEYGIKGIKYNGHRDGDCYVVFDDKAVSIIRKLSASRAKEAHTRAIEDIKAEVLKAFPGAKDVRDTGDRITFTMPNGAKVAIRIHDNMTVTDEEAARARRAHGIADGVTITVNGSEYTIGGQAVIDLSQRGEVGTVYHEALHVAMDLLFDDKTKSALMKKYGSEEKIADAYRKFMLAEARGGHVPFGKPLRAIRDFFRALAAHIAPIRKACGDAWTAQKAFEDLASGKAWEPASKKSHGFSLFSHAEAAERPIDNEAARGDNEVKKENQRIEQKNQKVFESVQKAFLNEVQKLRDKGWKETSIARAMNDENSAYRKAVVEPFARVYNQFHAKGSNKRDVVQRILGEKAFADLMQKNPTRRQEAIAEVFQQLSDRMEGVMNDARKTCIELADRFGNGQDVAGLHSWRDIEASSRKHHGGAAFTEHPAEVNHEQHHSVSRSETQDGFSDARKSDEEYLAAVDRYENAKTDEERAHALDDLRTMVQEAADAAGFHDAVPEQTVAYHTREGAAPKKTIKVYKVFTVSPDGSPTALFIGGTEKLPQGVWLDAQSAYHFQAANGKYYVPSTQNPYTKGGKTGASVEIPNEQVRQELIERGFLKPGSTAKKITALAYRPGWHAGTLPFFPQGGKKDASANYGMVHRENQVVFECELAADKNYTQEARSQEKAKTKAGKLNLKNADLQYMPENGFYFYATNPLTQSHPELGAWAISGSLKINRALSQEECDRILEKNGMKPQAWEQGKMNLQDLGYTGEQNDAARKTLAPITYDDSGNVIPLSERFNPEKHDIRYSISEEESKERAKGWLHSVGDKLAKGLHLKGEKIMLEEDAKDPSRDINLKQYIAASPSRVAEKVKTFRVLYVMADRAMNKVVSLRDGFERKLNKALALASSKDDRQDLFDLLLRGDAEGKEWTRQELIDDGVKENVADAYIQIRRQLNRAYHLVNDARRKPTPKSETVDKDRLAFLKANKFVTDLSVKDKGNGKYLVSYKEYKNYPKTYKEISADMVERFKNDTGIQVVDVKEAKTESGHAITDADGKPLYDVTTTEGPAELHKLKGYIPHFFHEYFLRVVDSDGNSRTIGSARNQREAVMQAEAWMKDHKLADGETIHVQPKVFDINKALGVSDDDFAPVMGDKDFLRVQKNLAKQNDMTLAEAKDMLDGAVRLKGRHRFFGNALHRTGAEGFETDLDWALRHYFNSASRYVAMETEFKPKAISYFERVFGAFDKDYNNNLLAKYCKDYINDINGTPSSLEQAISKALNSTWLFKKVVIPTFGDRAALTLGNGIANKISYMTLGLNMSSALLNFSQLMNSAAYIGDVRSLGQMMRKGMHRGYSLHELRILKETGVLNDIGIDSGSGYDKLRGGGTPSLGTGKIARALTGVNRGVDFLGQKSMYFFQQADSICRRGTVLVAYEKARKEGKSHAEAIAYAKDVNNKANFQYGTQDAPNIFRRGSIVSQLALQFKKYGFKELEVMADFSPWSKKTSRKQKLMFWGMYALLCGAMGVPALDWLDEIFGEKTGFYTKDELQKAIIHLCGNKKLAVSLMYGIPAAFNINLSSRAGLSDVIPTSLGDFAGPTISKSVRLAQDLLGGDYANALRDVNPGLYNLYAAGMGESRGKRDRLNDRYVTAWDRILRAVGFRSVDETIPTDMQRIISREKSAATKERQEAQDAYIKDPTSENKQRLKDLGIKEKDVQKEAQKKNQTREERTQGTVPKKDKDKYKPLTDFMKE